MRDWRQYVRSQFNPADLPMARADEISREIATQLEDFYRDALTRGASEEEADAYARAQVTDWPRMADEVRRAGLTPVADGSFVSRIGRRRPGQRILAQLWQDARLAIRQWLHAPGFAIVAVATLALGIGATTAVFSLVNGVLLRPLPYFEPNRLLTIWERNSDGTPDNVGYATYLDWRAQNQTFSDMALYTSWQPILQAGEPEELNGLKVTSSYFRLLGIHPELGRDFLPAEDNPNSLHVVILSHALWLRRFNGDPSIVGKTVAMNATTYLIAGVLPATYQSLMSQDPRGGTVEIWRVLGYDVSQAWACRTCHHLVAIGRLRNGVTVAQAQAEMDTISAALMRAYPKDYSAAGVILTPLRDHLLGDATTPLRILFGAVLFVLLVACANLANLFLARATNRNREIAVRTALGAGVGRIARQLLTENCLLALVGAGVGLIPAYWTPRVLSAIGTGDLPRLDGVELDWRVLTFTAATALATAILSALAPLHRIAQTDLHDSIRDGARGSAGGTTRQLQGLFVVAEVALSLTLLIGAGLLLRSLSNLITVSPGFEASHVLTIRASLIGDRYNDPATLRQFFIDATGRLRAIPGVEAAAAASQIPLTGNADRYGFHPEGKIHPNPELDDSAERYCITPGFLTAMGIPLIRGRDIGPEDATNSPGVLLISETTAKRIWPGEDALGKRVKVGGLDHAWLTVVGVVGDVHHIGLDVAPDLQMYIPHTQWPYPDSSMTFVLRTAGAPMALVAAARQAIHGLDPAQPLSRILTLDDYVGLSVQGRRFALLLVGLFAAIALFLSIIGIYGVTAYSVAQRTREIAIRMSLGARRRMVLAMFMREALSLVLTGTVVGVLASLLVTRFLASLLFNLTPTDPMTLGSVTTLLVAVALVAFWLPARRAMRVDPIVALRYE